MYIENILIFSYLTNSQRIFYFRNTFHHFFTISLLNLFCIKIILRIKVISSWLCYLLDWKTIFIKINHLCYFLWYLDIFVVLKLLVGLLHYHIELIWLLINFLDMQHQLLIKFLFIWFLHLNNRLLIIAFVLKIFQLFLSV